jgi:hypothetical protein
MMTRMVRELPEGWQGEIPKLPVDKERMAQFAVALVMVVAAAYLLLRGIDRGGSAVWGATVVAALLVIGAIALAIDRKAD